MWKAKQQNKHKVGLQTETVGVYVNERKNAEIVAEHYHLTFTL